MPVSLQEMRILLDGEVINPDRVTLVVNPADATLLSPDAITVVPSHSLHWICTGLAVSVAVIVPDTNHVPDDPCAMVGPSK